MAGAMAKRRKDHVDAIVEQWAQERPDLDTAALALFGRLFRAVQLADEALSRGLRGYELPRGGFDILAALRRAGVPYELNPTELMGATLVSSGGMTKQLDRLAQAGMVERRPDPADRRGTRVRLTQRGKATIDEAIETHIGNEGRLLASLSSEERARLDRLLRTLLDGLERVGAGPAA